MSLISAILLLRIYNTINIYSVIHIYPYIHFLFKYIGYAIYSIQILSHIFTSIINPGIPHRNNYINSDVMEILYNNMKLQESEMNFRSYKVCKICNILVKSEDHVVHCEDCGVCVKGNYFFFIFIF